MARKKQEIQLQQEIESQEEWEEMMAKEGLWVVDIYQEWCGPCSAMVSNFRRLKNEIGDDLLHFATAKVDTIDGLDKYKGRCEPTFLFFACGIMVAVIHGSQAPRIIRTITEQLAQEHKVMDGATERKEIKDTLLSQLETHPQEEDDEEDNEKDDDEVKGFTVAIIKPDAVQNGKVDEILEQMREKGIEVMAEVERQLTEDEAREFYSHVKDEEYFDELVKFMSSGPSHVLVLTKGSTEDNVLTEWRDMIGPTSVNEAKEEAPDSLRAKYGSGSVMNALHGSSSPETAAREMAFFFPNLSTVNKKKSKISSVQRTLALIRPDAFRTRKDEIMSKIKEAGFKVALQKTMTLTKEQASDFYKEHEGQPYFEDLITRMSNGPLMALGLAREDAVQGWREMLGPKEVEKAKEEAPESLRAQFSVEDVEINQLHGSDSSTTAEKELEYFFPMEQTVACIKPDAIGTKDAIIEKIHEAGFRIAAQKETKITKDIAEEFYSEHKDKEYYNDLVEHMCSGPTMFMVLSREDAVSGWRDAIGPTDPETAKNEIPDSIRAMFGSDVLKNAVHGSSDPEHAKKSIEQVFGTLEFNSDAIQPVHEEVEEASRRSSVAPVGEVAPEHKPEDTPAETAADTTPEEKKDTDTTSQKDSTEEKTGETNQNKTDSDPPAESGEKSDSDIDKDKNDKIDTQQSAGRRKSTDSKKSVDRKSDKSADNKSNKEPDTTSLKLQTDSKFTTEDTTSQKPEDDNAEDKPTVQDEEKKTDSSTEQNEKSNEEESTEKKDDAVTDTEKPEEKTEEPTDGAKTEENKPEDSTDKPQDSTAETEEAK